MYEVIAVHGNGGAEAGGLLPGDRLLKIDGEETKGMNLASVIDAIRGPASTLAVLAVKRDKEELELKCQRRRMVRNVRTGG